MLFCALCIAKYPAENNQYFQNHYCQHFSGEKGSFSLSAWFISLSVDVKGICPDLHTETFPIVTNRLKFL